MSRPLLLDLFCCQGGAATGYHRAGFDILGVDIEPQPRYPFPFVQADALEALAGWNLERFAAIHASPPCQAFTTMSARWRARGGTIADTRVDLLTPVLEILRGTDIPWIVENVAGARKHMRPTLALHGGMFGMRVHRPRFFESSELILAPPAPLTTEPVAVYGDHPQQWTGRHPRSGHAPVRRAQSVDEAREVMGMPWADWHGCIEAIPPAYTEHIGLQLIEHLRECAA